jgi:hypothetical protein
MLLFAPNECHYASITNYMEQILTVPQLIKTRRVFRLRMEETVSKRWRVAASMLIKAARGDSSCGRWARG